MHVTVLGSSGSYPAKGNPGSGYLVESGDVAVLLDAGPGVFMALADVLAPEELDAVAISHRHLDHCADLLAIHGYLAQRFGGARSVRVLSPPDVADALSGFLDADSGHSLFTTCRFEFVDAGVEAQVGGVALRFARTAHSVPTLAVRLEAEGRALVYSADSGPGGGLAGLADSADLLLCEATLSGSRDAHSYPYHLTAAEAGELAEQAGVRRLVVTHVPSTLDRQRVAEEAAAVYHGDTAVAQPGMQIAV